MSSTPPDPSATDAKPQVAADTARTAGLGGLAILAAKVFFILSGLIQQVILPRVIGLDGFGALQGRVFPVANIVNNVVITSSIQGVSRSVAQTPDEHAGQTLRRMLKTHIAIAIPLALAFFFFAPVYAVHFALAPHIARPLQIVSLVVLAYGLYTPLVGSLNGQRRFTAQAALDVTYATLRTAGLIGLGYLAHRIGHGVIGACIGFALAAVIIFPIALRTTGLGSKGDAGPTVREHLVFISAVAAGQIFLQLLLQMDIMVLGRFASQLTIDSGLVDKAAQKASDEIVGVYKACQMFAFLPFQLLITLTFIMFPMLAKAKAEQDPEKVASHVRTGMRLAFVFACIMVGTVSSLAPHVLRLLFPAEVGDRGGDALRILSLGQGCFAIFYIETTVLTSLGRERRSALLTAIAVALIAVLCWVVGTTSPDSASLLIRTAMATSIALLCAMLVGAVLVYQTAGAYVSPLTVVRVLLALGVASAAGWFMPYLGKVLVIPQAAGIGLLIVILLVITGEVGKQDLQLVLKLVRPKKA